MVRFTILLITLLLINLMVFAQPRHVQGMGMLGLIAGIGDNTKTFGISYQKFTTAEISINMNGAVNWVYFPLSDYHSYYFNPQIHYTLLSNKRQVYLNAIGGLNGGLEHLKSKLFNRIINNIYFGESLGLGIEYFFLSQYKIELGFEQQFLQRSKISDYQYYFKLGTYVEF